jgi:hypothetical protein
MEEATIRRGSSLSSLSNHLRANLLRQTNLLMIRTEILLDRREPRTKDRPRGEGLAVSRKWFLLTPNP